MSFILDALKKSDAKRRAQLGPDLATPTAPTAPSSQRQSKLIMIWGLLGLVGALSVGGGVVWFVSDRDALSSSVPGTQQAVASPTEAVGRGLDAEPEPGPSQSMQPTEPVEIIEESVAAVPSEAVTPSTAPPATVEQTQSVADTAPTSQPAPALPEPDPASVEALEARLAAASERESKAGAVSEVEESAEAIGTESLAQVDEPEEVWQPQAADYLYQWELPLTVRQSLPALNLLVHVYSNVPEDRFVLINGTRFREGDELSPGVRLAEIRPEGALIDFRDYRFLLSQ